MRDALIAGQRDPAALADLAQRQLPKKIPALTEALQGRFNNHHAVTVRLYLDRIDAHEADIARLDARIAEAITPVQHARHPLVSTPGFSPVVAEVFIAETGADMSVFPTAEHLASWAGVAPGSNESAGRITSAKTRPGNRHLKTALGVAALSASRSTNTYFGARYRRIAGPRPPQARTNKSRRQSAAGQTAVVALERCSPAPGTCLSTASSTKTPAPTTTPHTDPPKPKPEPSNNSKPSDTTSPSNPAPTPPNPSAQPTHQLLVTLNFRVRRAKSTTDSWGDWCDRPDAGVAESIAH